MKRVIVSALLIAMTACMAACGSAQSGSADSAYESSQEGMAMISASEMPSSDELKGIAEYFGPFTVSVHTDYTKSYLSSADQTIYCDGEYEVIYLNNGFGGTMSYLTDGTDWYMYALVDGDEEEKVVKIVAFDGGEMEEELEEEYPIATFEPLKEDREASDENAEDHSYGGSQDWIDNSDKVIGTVNYTVEAGADYRTNKAEVECVTEDGETFSTATYTYEYDVPEDETLAVLKQKLSDAKDAVRHLTYNAVSKGEVVETFEAEAPAGLYVSAYFPSDYYDEGDLTFYSDKELKTESHPTDLTADVEIYMKAPAQ